MSKKRYQTWVGPKMKHLLQNGREKFEKDYGIKLSERDISEIIAGKVTIAEVVAKHKKRKNAFDFQW